LSIFGVQFRRWKVCGSVVNKSVDHRSAPWYRSGTGMTRFAEEPDEEAGRCCFSVPSEFADGPGRVRGFLRASRARADPRSVYTQATASAKTIRRPEDRSGHSCRGLERAADTLDRILLPVVENLDSLLYLGGTALLEELRGLSAAHADEPGVRLELAKALVNTIYYAKEEQDLDRRDALLAELGEAAHREPRTGPPLVVLGRWLAANPGESSDGAASTELDAGQALLREETEEERWWLAEAALARADLGRNQGDAEAGLGHLGRALEMWMEVPDTERVAMVLTRIAQLPGHFNWDTSVVERSVGLLGSTARRVPEPSREAMLSFGAGLLRERGPDALRAVLPKLEASLEGTAPGFLRPLRLGMEALEHGEEKALAREPEEMRRVGRLLLDRLRE